MMEVPFMARPMSHALTALRHLEDANVIVSDNGKTHYTQDLRPKTDAAD
jgi:hypothetical protein